MASRLQRLRQTGFFSELPVELTLAVNENLTIKDKLSLSDTSRAYRPLITDAECIQACTTAGLSIPPHITARAMAKLLCRPRVGVCNWSYEGGIPKSGLDKFSKVISITSAIREKCSVALHPVFEAMGYMYFTKTSTFEMVHLRVAKNQPEILLCQHRLYIHEYVTSPPLDELHVMIKGDEGPLDDGYVAFRIRNPKGVTLGNYYQGLFRLFAFKLFTFMRWKPLTRYLSLNAAPDPRMPLTKQVITSDLDSDTRKAMSYFNRNCPTNLDMLDLWYEAHEENVPFSEMAITSNLPLYKGALTLVIYAEDPEIVEDHYFIDEVDHDINWGEPHREPEIIYFLPISDEELWKDKAPLILL